MDELDAGQAVRAAMRIGTTLGLRCDDAVVLQASNRIVMRLLPCDVLARVARPAQRDEADLEVVLARRLAEAGSPVATLDPRVEPVIYECDGFIVTYWTYYDGAGNQDVAAAEFAHALRRLHAGLRTIDFALPHFSDRAARMRALVDDRERTPDLAEADRDLLSTTLRQTSTFVESRGAPEQLLHGEPHPGNVLRTKDGLLFTDFETARRGPVEFDIAWYTRVGPGAWFNDAALPDAVGRHYPGADLELIRACWIQMVGIVAAHRFDRIDQFPDRQQRREEWLGHLRAAVERHGMPG